MASGDKRSKISLGFGEGSLCSIIEKVRDWSMSFSLCCQYDKLQCERGSHLLTHEAFQTFYIWYTKERRAYRIWSVSRSVKLSFFYKSSTSEIWPETEFLDVIGARVLKSFPPCYSQTPPALSKSCLKLLCNVNIVYGNLKSENSQDYAQKPQLNCTFMNSFSDCSF